MTRPDPTRNVRLLLGAAFTAAGIAHIAKHEWFENLVPEPLAPWRKPIRSTNPTCCVTPEYRRPWHPCASRHKPWSPD